MAGQPEGDLFGTRHCFFCGAIHFNNFYFFSGFSIPSAMASAMALRVSGAGPINYGYQKHTLFHPVAPARCIHGINERSIREICTTRVVLIILIVYIYDYIDPLFKCKGFSNIFDNYFQLSFKWLFLAVFIFCSFSPFFYDFLLSRLFINSFFTRSFNFFSIKFLVNCRLLPRFICLFFSDPVFFPLKQDFLFI